MDNAEAKGAAQSAAMANQIRLHTQTLEVRYQGAVAFLRAQGYPADIVAETAIQHALAVR